MTASVDGPCYEEVPLNGNSKGMEMPSVVPGRRISTGILEFEDMQSGIRFDDAGAVVVSCCSLQFPLVKPWERTAFTGGAGDQRIRLQNQ